MMDRETFASGRRETLTVADDAIRPAVEDALRIRPASRWYEGIVDAAAQVWLENHQAEAPGSHYSSALSRFRTFIEDSLKKTADSTNVDRVTRWAATLAVNAGTITGAASSKVTHKRWVTMHDTKVRDLHDDMDGVIVPMGGVFNVAGSKLPYPGAPVGPPEVWIECRCVAQPAARDGSAMSLSTFQIGPEDVVDENAEILLGYDVMTADAEYHGDTTEGDAVAEAPVQKPDADVASGAVVEWTDEMGTRYYGPFDTVENAQRWIESDNTPFDGEAGVIGLVGVPEGESVIAAAFEMAGVIADEDSITIIDEDEEPEEGDDELSDEIPIHGVLAPEAVETGDGRGFREGALSVRPLPVPYRYEYASTHGGNTSDVATVGRIDEAWRDEKTGFWRFRGVIITSKQYADRALEAIIDGSGPGVSIDADQMAVDMEGFSDEALEAAQTEGRNPTTWYTKARVAGLTQVPIPAFHEAYVALGHDFEEDKSDEDRQADLDALAACGCLDSAESTEEEEEDVPVLASAEFAPGTHDGPGWITDPKATSRLRRYWTRGEGAAKIRWGTGGDFNRCRRLLAKYVQNPEWLAGLCANMHFDALGFWPATHARKGRHSLIASGGIAAEPIRLVASAATVYPSAAFAEPTEDHAFALRIDRETRTISGYAASWGSCHIGIQGMCREAPHSETDYRYFRKGIVETDAGEQPVGLITYGIGHAGEMASAASATAHYDQTEAVRAYINIGENMYGIWFSGVLAPWVTDADIDAMLAIRRVSGDWRNWSGRPGDLEMVGLVVVNTEGFQLAASGGVQTAAIGLGVVEPEAADFLAASGETHEDFVRRVSTEVLTLMAQRDREARLRSRAYAIREADLRARAKERV